MRMETPDGETRTAGSWQAAAGRKQRARRRAPRVKGSSAMRHALYASRKWQRAAGRRRKRKALGAVRLALGATIGEVGREAGRRQKARPGARSVTRANGRYTPCACGQRQTAVDGT